MPKKRSTGKTRSRKPKPRQKQKQKQKQVQKVSVNVSGGGSGIGGFIPIPQAPSFDYAALASLIRPAATVDMPIVAQAARPVANLPVGAGIEARSASGSIRPSFSSSSAKVGGGSSKVAFERPTSQQSAPSYFDETESGTESEANVRSTFERLSALKRQKQREMLREPIDVRGVSKEAAKRAFEFSQNPEQEFIISRPSRGGKSKSTSLKETFEL